MSRFHLSAKPFVAALAGAAVLGAASGARADHRLLPVAAMPEADLTLVSDSGARAFDHIRAARQQIESRRAFEARQELAQARKLLAEARAAVPANRVQDRIAALLVRIEDPSTKLSYTDVDPIYAEIQAVGGGDPYGATWRYIERARYQLWNQDRAGATRELLAASARVPYGRIDAPLGASYERVNQAMILLYDLDLAGADALLAAAEGNAHAVVQIASGAELPMDEHATPEVSAAPEPMTLETMLEPAAAPEPAPAAEPEASVAPAAEAIVAPEAEAIAAPEPEASAAEMEAAPEASATPEVSAAPAATESEIPAASDFQESQEPAATEETAPEAAPAEEAAPEAASEAPAAEEAAPEAPAADEPAPEPAVEPEPAPTA